MVRSFDTGRRAFLNKIKKLFHNVSTHLMAANIDYSIQLSTIHPNTIETFVLTLKKESRARVCIQTEHKRPLQKQFMNG